MLGQQFFRIKADFSIKENLPTGESILTIGTVYFDKHEKKIVYLMSFPRKAIQILLDTVYYEIENGKIIEKQKAFNLLQFSIFNLALSSKLNNYGLENNGIFTLSNVEKKDSLVISTWSPSNKKVADATGNVLIAQKKKQLNGLVFYNKDRKIVSKQFFDNYSYFNGLAFPGEIVQVNYLLDKEYYKVTTYNNIEVNSLKENEIYNYPIPVQ